MAWLGIQAGAVAGGSVAAEAVSHSSAFAVHGDAKWLVVTATRTAKRALKAVFAGKQAGNEAFQVEAIH